MQLKMFKFFLVSANHKKKSGNSGTIDVQVQYKARLFFEKTTIAVNWVEHQHTVNIMNWENGPNGFQKNW